VFRPLFGDLVKKLLITGGSGFLGQHLAKQLKGEYEVVLASRNQKALFAVGKKLGLETAPLDVTSYSATYELFKRVKPDLVIHGAATKFVDLAEKYPNDCIDTNIVGSQNVARAAIENDVSYVVGISTDKAAPPIANIYGLSKAVMEKLFVSLDGVADTRFGCVRYGNVAWSTGSVFPIWKQMLEEKGRILTTGPDMSRFFFPVTDAVGLIQKAIKYESVVAGKVLSLPMRGAEVRRILDLWTRETKAIWEVGQRRPGDRDLEYLISDVEMMKTTRIPLEGEDFFLLDLNAHMVENHLDEQYSSRTAIQLTDDEILDLVVRKPITEV
jgi:UDP-N-acetylglucosamine 4,6-dehydratase